MTTINADMLFRTWQAPECRQDAVRATTGARTEVY
jgi:hypothetical protein